MGLFGIDISEHNGSAFEPAKYSPDFVILRLGYARTEDRLFRSFLSKCEKTGIPWGVYLYSYAENVEEAKKEARFVIDTLHGLKKGPQMGVWFDMEDADGYKARRGIMAFNADTISRICGTFCDELDAAGYYTGIYASKYWFDKYIRTFYPRWTAAWGNNDGSRHGDYSGDSILHQYTSRYKGANLDASFFYGTTPKLTKEKQKGDGMGKIDRLVFGMHDLTITQGPYGLNGSSHKNGALDLAGQDTGIDFWYCQSRMKCLGPMTLHKNGRTSGGYGTYAFTFVDSNGEPVKVKLADGSERFVTLAMTHSNQKYTKCTKGKIYEKGQPCYEEGGRGASGPNTFGNHIHIEVAEGVQTDKYYRPEIATYTMNNELDPRRCFFIFDKYTTKIRNTQGMTFKHCDAVTTETAAGAAETAKTGDITAAVIGVLQGKYGNGETRKTALKKAGYDPATVQAKVNTLLKTMTVAQALASLQVKKN